MIAHWSPMMLLQLSAIATHEGSLQAKAIEDIAGIYDRLEMHSRDIAEKVEVAILAATELLGERPCSVS